MSRGFVIQDGISGKDRQTSPPKRQLNETLFRSLVHTRAVLEAWRADYNNDRPHSRLGWMTPVGYAATRRSAKRSNYTGCSAQRTAPFTAHEAPSNARLQSQMDKSWGQRQP